MTEKQLEQKLKKEVEKLGGLCLKLTTPGFTGIPDRLILLPGGKVWFVEVKKPGEQIEEGGRQDIVLQQLQTLGFCAGWIGSEKALTSMMDWINSPGDEI